MKELLARIAEAEEGIHKYFGYEGDWRIYPIDDNTNAWWHIDGTSVHFQLNEPTKDQLEYDPNVMDEAEEMEYSAEVVRIFGGDEYTAIIMDTHCDGNIYFGVFDNKKRVAIKTV